MERGEIASFLFAWYSANITAAASATEAKKTLTVSDPQFAINVSAGLTIAIEEVTASETTGSRGTLYLSTIEGGDTPVLATYYLDKQNVPHPYTPSGTLNADPGYCFVKIYRIQVKSSEAVSGDRAIALRGVAANIKVERDDSNALFLMADSFSGIVETNIANDAAHQSAYAAWTFGTGLTELTSNQVLYTKFLAVRVDGGGTSGAQTPTNGDVSANFKVNVGSAVTDD